MTMLCAPRQHTVYSLVKYTCSRSRGQALIIICLQWPGSSKKCTDQKASWMVKRHQSQLVRRLQHLTLHPGTPPWCQESPLGLHHPRWKLSACSKHPCKMSQGSVIQHCGDDTCSCSCSAAEHAISLWLGSGPERRSLLQQSMLQQSSIHNYTCRSYTVRMCSDVCCLASI